jgi:hypothetical protein
MTMVAGKNNDPRRIAGQSQQCSQRTDAANRPVVNYLLGIGHGFQFSVEDNHEEHELHEEIPTTSAFFVLRLFS